MIKNSTLGFKLNAEKLRGFVSALQVEPNQSARALLRLSQNWSRANDRLKANRRNLTFSAQKKRKNMRKKMRKTWKDRNYVELEKIEDKVLAMTHSRRANHTRWIFRILLMHPVIIYMI